MRDWWCLSKKIKENKYLEWQVGHYKYEKSNIFNFSIDWTRHCDHAGLNIVLKIWNFYSYFSIYDSRHWCYYCMKFENHTHQGEYSK